MVPYSGVSVKNLLDCATDVEVEFFFFAVIIAADTMPFDLWSGVATRLPSASFNHHE